MFDKARTKLRHGSKDMEELAGDEEEFERQRQKEIEQQKRKEEYEKLALNQKTKFGSGGMSFGSG